ncbi:MAG: hypothetical protein R6X33_01295 [Candidatus Brocadiia bacterium]
MDGIDVTCPRCGASSAAPESLAGGGAQCRSCGHVIEVPAVHQAATTRMDPAVALGVTRAAECSRSGVTVRWAVVALLCGVAALMLHSMVWPGLLLGIASVPFLTAHLKQRPTVSGARLYVFGLVTGMGGLIAGLIGIGMAAVAPPAPEHALALPEDARPVQEEMERAESIAPFEEAESPAALPVPPPAPAVAHVPERSAGPPARTQAQARVYPTPYRTQSSTLMEPGQLRLPSRVQPLEAEPEGAGAKTREEIIEEIRGRCLAEAERIQSEEDARYREQYQKLQSEYVYPDKFSAVMRQVDGQQLNHNVWDAPLARYPGGGSAARALNDLKSLPVPEWERRVAQLRNEVAPLGEADGRQQMAPRNPGIRSNAGVPSSQTRSFGYSSTGNYTDPRGLNRHSQGQIDPLEREIFFLQQRIRDAYGRLRHWEQQEAVLRSREAQHVRGLANRRDARIEQRLRSLWKDPDYAFVYQHIELENEIRERREVIQRKQNVIEMLRRSGAEKRIGGLQEQIAAERERTGKLQKQLDELIESHFRDRAL